MVTAFYFIVFVVSLIMMGMFLFRNKNADTLFVLFGIAVVTNCMGRYMVAASENLEMALRSNIFLYLGGCFAPPLVLFLLAQLCGRKIHTALKIFMVAFSSVVMALVMTIGRSGIYYKNVELAYGNGHNYLVKTYGPLHILYPIMMLMYAVIMVFYIVYAIKNRNRLSFRMVSTISVACFAVIAMYILERALGSNISFLSLGYLFGFALMIKQFDRLNIYDMSSNIINTVEKMNEYGYIVFDDKYRYISSNGYIKEIFPEINNWSVDREVAETDSVLYKAVVLYLRENGLSLERSAENVKSIQVGERFFDVNTRLISYKKNKKAGYLVEFIDRTLERKYYNAIEDYNADLKKEVETKTENILHIKDMMVLGMAEMVESRDNSTGGHIKRTSDVIKIFSEKLNECGDEYGFDEQFLQMLTKAAPMHDLGKIAVDDVILRKPGKFTPEEFEKMKVHPAEGAKIIENILRGVEDNEFVELASNVAHYHHEKWNGKGYPMGLAGTDIPIEARIMALADVFDALVSKRCYKDALSYDDAFRIIEESLGEHFDPKLGKIFLKCKTELVDLYSKLIS